MLSSVHSTYNIKKMNITNLSGRITGVKLVRIMQIGTENVAVGRHTNGVAAFTGFS